jgi:hypothetical protein
MPRLPSLRAQRSNPGQRDASGRGGSLDCFAALAKTAERAIFIKPKLLSSFSVVGERPVAIQRPRRARSTRRL